MTAFFIYLFKVIVCSAMFAGCYWCLLRNGRFYQWNRFCIVTSVALSITIPALNIPISAPHLVTPLTTGYAVHTVTDPARLADAPLLHEVSTVPWVWIAFMFCLSVVILLLAKEAISFTKILRLKRHSERMHTSEAVLYCTDDAAAPFTFFRTIFWKKGISVDSGEGRCMLRHELVHVRLGHSWDKALMQLVCCLFWMNPFFMLFRRELELVHEFAADSESNAEELSSLILCTLYPNHYSDFTSRFFQSSVKRRIIMMTKSKNKKSSMNVLRKMSIVPVALVAIYLFACNSEGQNGVNTVSQPLSESVWQDSWKPRNDMEEPVIVVGYGPVKDGIPQKKDVIVTHESERKIARGVISYHEVEQKPVFQGTDNNFRRYLAWNLTYLAKAQENGICGTVVVSFVIDKDGNVTDVKSPVKIEYLSNEVERVIQSSSAWKPGSQGGKNVAVQCYAFVEFKIDTGSDPAKSSSADVKTQTNEEEAMLFATVAVKPTFNGKDAETGFREYIRENTVYPPESKEKGVTGRVYVEFTIDSDGSVTNVRLLRGADPLLDAEALRVVKASPKWGPGKDKDGKAVKVKYQFPILFNLNN